MGLNQELNPQVEHGDILRLSIEIVASYVSQNEASQEELQGLIISAVQAASGLSKATPAEIKSTQKPLVLIRKSVTPDCIVCLEDGKKLKMMKRHLRTYYKLTPEAYRAKWGLPPDYPMVAPNYAKKRSQFAKQLRLGRK